MKKLLSLLFIIFLIGCTNSNEVYWCGDHPCVNKKERESYFKKTMIIEVKKLNAKEKKEYSEVEKIFEQAYIKKEKKANLEEKKLAKEIRLQEKERLKEEKKLAKEIRLEEKERLKAEEELAKLEIIKEKKKLKQEKKLHKKNKTSKKNKLKKEKNSQTLTVGNDNSNFSQIIEKIIKRNLSKPYPSLNDVPN